jgi:pumilio RNA-binding family
MLNLLNGYKNYSIIANDVFASHIIIKLLSFNKIYINCYIYEKINDDLVEISMNRHGCCVLTKILESKSSFNDIIINNIINNLMTLIIDQYGHYLILYIIKSDLRSYKRKLIMNIIPNFTYLAIQIYSSTVLEKCFEFCEDDIKYILYQHLENVDTIKTLICDEYGNYVIQKAILKTPNDNIRYVLFRNIFSIINDIKNDNFGRQFFVKLCKQYPLFQKLISNP